MKVRFLGADGSLGYRTGQVYDVQIQTDWSGRRPTITQPTHCPYHDWDAFWFNWERVAPTFAEIQERIQVLQSATRDTNILEEFMKIHDKNKRIQNDES